MSEDTKPAVDLLSGDDGGGEEAAEVSPTSYAKDVAAKYSIDDDDIDKLEGKIDRYLLINGLLFQMSQFISRHISTKYPTNECF